MSGLRYTFYEFFAGGGMAHAGLGIGNWDCLFANDFDHKKCGSYSRNWGDDALVCGDVAKLKAAELPGRSNLVWASFPCQDLSLAGGGAGLHGDRSGTFWPFWRLMDSLIADGRAPDIIALENVTGTLTSHGGKDFEAICNSFVEFGLSARSCGDRRSALCATLATSFVCRRGSRRVSYSTQHNWGGCLGTMASQGTPYSI